MAIACAAEKVAGGHTTLLPPYPAYWSLDLRGSGVRQTQLNPCWSKFCGVAGAFSFPGKKLDTKTMKHPVTTDIVLKFINLS